jgi:hypothetical protein
MEPSTGKLMNADDREIHLTALGVTVSTEHLSDCLPRRSVNLGGSFQRKMKMDLMQQPSLYQRSRRERMVAEDENGDADVPEDEQ